MKIVINTCYGGFGVSDEVAEILSAKGLEDTWDIPRTDETLIELIETKGADFCGGSYADLEVVEIPDEATDWTIQEYDGSESLIYVLDGKLHWA